jgi:hypothetical protein
VSKHQPTTQALLLECTHVQRVIIFNPTVKTLVVISVL